MDRRHDAGSTLGRLDLRGTQGQSRIPRGPLLHVVGRVASGPPRQATSGGESPATPFDGRSNSAVVSRSRRREGSATLHALIPRPTLWRGSSCLWPICGTGTTACPTKAASPSEWTTAMRRLLRAPSPVCLVQRRIRVDFHHLAVLHDENAGAVPMRIPSARVERPSPSPREPPACRDRRAWTREAVFLSRSLACSRGSAVRRNSNPHGETIYASDSTPTAAAASVKRRSRLARAQSSRIASAR